MTYLMQEMQSGKLFSFELMRKTCHTHNDRMNLILEFLLESGLVEELTMYNDKKLYKWRTAKEWG